MRTVASSGLWYSILGSETNDTLYFCLWIHRVDDLNLPLGYVAIVEGLTVTIFVYEDAGGIVFRLVMAATAGLARSDTSSES